MYITYDSHVDAVYIKLIPGRHRVITVNVDDDIALNLDEEDRLVGIEVLDASKRLELSSLLPVEATSYVYEPDSISQNSSEDSDWDKLKRELRRRKEAGVPVETLHRHWKNWVEEIGEDYVVVRRDRTGRTLKITRAAFEGGAWEWAITRAMRKLASSL